MKKKGDVPIPYIIALILGIAIVAVIGYWFFVLSGLWGGEATLSDCRARAYTYCASWQVAGYDTNKDADGTPLSPKLPFPTGSKWFREAYPKCEIFEASLGFSTGDVDAKDVTTDINVCKAVMATGQGGGGGGGGTPTTGGANPLPGGM